MLTASYKLRTGNMLIETIIRNHVDGPCQYSSLPNLPGKQQQVIQHENGPKVQLLPPSTLTHCAKAKCAYVAWQTMHQIKPSGKKVTSGALHCAQGSNFVQMHLLHDY